MPAHRKPASLHYVAGTYRPGRHAGPAGAEGSDQPLGPPPRALSPSARRVWREAAELAPWLRIADRHGLEIYSVLMAAFRAEPATLSGRPLAVLSSLQGRLGLLWADRQRQRPDPVDKPALDPVEEKYFKGAGL